MAQKTLIFPGGMPGSLAYLATCQSDQRLAIGASSLNYDPNRAQYAEWVHLPFLADANFDIVLDEVIKDRGITDIFTPHPIVWKYLHERTQSGRLAVPLLTAKIFGEAQPYRRALSDGNFTLLSLHISDERPSLPMIEAASILYHAEKISGMCDGDKARALIEIFRSMPQGDVVEIGSWWGKSAFILHRLSHLYDVGPLLCIDPWASENLVQNDDSGLVDRMVATVDIDEAHRIFVINMLPYVRGDANYLRMPADQALAAFLRKPHVQSVEFGTTCYAGTIAALHIDGNHAYEHARDDIIGWTKLVAAGGWIIIDDYVWPWGDGPQRAGDEFLVEHWCRIDCAFVMGTALFIRLQYCL